MKIVPLTPEVRFHLIYDGYTHLALKATPLDSFSSDILTFEAVTTPVHDPGYKQVLPLDSEEMNKLLIDCRKNIFVVIKNTQPQLSLYTEKEER